MKIALTGDIMLGRLVDCYLVQDFGVAPPAIWGDVLPLLSSADLRLGNLECVISTKGQKWNPSIKPFHFRTHPRAIEFLQAAQFHCVSLANNHILDFGPEALLECLALLDRGHIAHVGAGRQLSEAQTPVFLKSPVGQVAVIALTDNEPAWEATMSQSGTNFIDYNSEGIIPPYDIRIKKVIGQARRTASLVIVSAHVGPNWGPPSVELQKMAHQLVDMGVDIFWGHSNHTPQGLEIYKGKPILYSTGDFVDDYAVDPLERNDLSFLFLVETSYRKIVRVRLYPVAIENFRVRRANGSETSFLQKTMEENCAAFTTNIEFQNDIGTVLVG